MARFDYQPDDYEPATIDYELATIDFQGLSTLSARKRLATLSRLWDTIDFGDFLAWATIDYYTTMGAP